MNHSNGRAGEPAILQALMALEVDYWHEVDHNWGRRAHEFYAVDGVFAIGAKEMRGPDAVAAFYRWREGRGERTARHVVTNFRIESRQGSRVQFECILCLYAADGRPVLPSRPAIMIADILSECELGPDGQWRFMSHRLVPIFEGGEKATVPEN